MSHNGEYGDDVNLSAGVPSLREAQGVDQNVGHRIRGESLP
jgi:hypothetical protein